jgi:hypothetical protein
VDFGNGKKLTFEKADAAWAAVAEASRPMALREVCVKVGGVSRKMLVLGSVPYD